jgi:hypothetical protein
MVIYNKIIGGFSVEYSYYQRVRIANSYLNSMPFMSIISFDFNRNRAVWAQIMLSGTKEEIVANLYGGSCCFLHFKSNAAIREMRLIDLESNS